MTGRGPFLHLCVNDINGCESLADLGLASDLKEQAEEELEEEVCLPGLSPELLLGGGGSMSESQFVSPQTHKDNCFSCAGEFGRVFRCGEDRTVKRMGG